MQDENNQTVGLNGRRNYTLLVGHSGPVYSATFSPPGDYVLSSSADTTSMYLCIPLHDIHILAQFEFFLLPTFVFVSAVRLWSTKLNANLVCYKGHNHTVWDAQVELFVLHKLEFYDEQTFIYTRFMVQFSPFGHYFASCSHDRTARIWSMDRMQPLRMMAGHLSDVDVSVSLLHFNFQRLNLATV